MDNLEIRRASSLPGRLLEVELDARLGAVEGEPIVAEIKFEFLVCHKSVVKSADDRGKALYSPRHKDFVIARGVESPEPLGDLIASPLGLLHGAVIDHVRAEVRHEVVSARLTCVIVRNWLGALGIGRLFLGRRTVALVLLD